MAGRCRTVLAPAKAARNGGMPRDPPCPRPRRRGAAAGGDAQLTAAPCTQGLGRRDLRHLGSPHPDTAPPHPPPAGMLCPTAMQRCPETRADPPHLRDVPPRGEGAPQWCHPAVSCSGTSQAAVTLSWSSSAVTDGTGPGDQEASLPAQHPLCHEQQAGRTPPAGPAAPMGLTPAPAAAWAVSEAVTPLQAAGVRK